MSFASTVVNSCALTSGSDVVAAGEVEAWLRVCDPMVSGVGIIGFSRRDSMFGSPVIDGPSPSGFVEEACCA